jgi:hypothetical protein
MLVTVLIIIAALIVGFVIVVAMQPSQFRITRSASIPAPAAEVFEEVNDFHRWNAWSPWARLDPAAKNTFEGAESGEGAIFHWTGNKQVGEGRMTLLESRPAEYIRIKLEFLKPFQATNTTEFTFKPADGQTLVTWTMSGTNNFVSKAFVMVMNCDKMIGGQFEQGLENLKSVVAATVHQ